MRASTLATQIYPKSWFKTPCGSGWIRRGHARKREEWGCDGRGWCAGLHDGGQLALGGRVVCAGQAVAASVTLRAADGATSRKSQPVWCGSQPQVLV